MKKCIIIILLAVVVGCNNEIPQEPKISDQLAKTPENWIEKYGESEETAMGFNVALLLHHHNNQVEQIKELGERISILERDRNGEERN